MTAAGTGAAAPLAVLIHGSCVTRDAFALAEEPRFKLVDYYARSCLASAFASRGLVEVDTSTIASSFQRRMVERDLGKHFSQRLRDIDAEVIVVDLVDERHDVFVDRSGGTGTRSAELLQAQGLAPDLLRVASGSADFLLAWEAGRRRFMEEARGAGVLDRIVVHEALWAERCADGTSFDYDAVAAANHLLQFMYARLRRDLAEEQFLRVPERFVLGDPDHRWGRSPVHYVPEYYRTFLDLLGERVGRTR